MHAIQQGYISPTRQTSSATFPKNISELTTVDGLVLRGTKLVVPATLRDKVVTHAHEGHRGIVWTKQLLRSTLWFPSMDRMIEKEISQCMTFHVTVKIHPQEPLKPLELPSEPCDKLATGFYGPLATGEHLLVMQCLHSRYLVVEIVTSTKATIPAMDKVLSLFGIPSEITSDNRPCYDSEDLKNYAKYMGFKHTPKIPYTPWANATAENFMKTLGKLMQTASEEHLT